MPAPVLAAEPLPRACRLVGMLLWQATRVRDRASLSDATPTPPSCARSRESLSRRGVFLLATSLLRSFETVTVSAAVARSRSVVTLQEL
eukprot:4755187-Pleurochrysis_carterae.AAC.1